MSQSLSSLATGLGLADLANSVLNGADTFLVLGNVTFADVELPQQMPFGGMQSLVKHDLPGGVRYIDSMGAFARDAAWQGMLYGPDAVIRAQTIDAMRKAGTAVALNWDTFYYSVVVASFDADYHNPQYITYSISCTVLEDLSQPAPQSDIGPIAQAYADVNQALGLASVVASSGSPTVALSAALTALQGNPMILGSSGYVTGLGALQNASSTAVAARDAAGATLDTTAAANTTSLASLVTQAGAASGYATAAAFVGRAVQNAVIGAV